MTRLAGRVGALVGRLLLPLTVVGLVAGLLATAAGADELAWWCWTVPSLVVGTRLAVSIVRDLLRGEAGVDVIAVLAIGGALLFGESLAAAVIGVMLATGEWLERFAEGRAHRELSALISRAPRVVHRYEAEGIVDRPDRGGRRRRPARDQARARSSRSTAWSTGPRPCSTSRR